MKGISCSRKLPSTAQEGECWATRTLEFPSSSTIETVTPCPRALSTLEGSCLGDGERACRQVHHQWKPHFHRHLSSRNRVEVNPFAKRSTNSLLNEASKMGVKDFKYHQTLNFQNMRQYTGLDPESTERRKNTKGYERPKDYLLGIP